MATSVQICQRLRAFTLAVNDAFAVWYLTAKEQDQGTLMYLIGDQPPYAEKLINTLQRIPAQLLDGLEPRGEPITLDAVSDLYQFADPFRWPLLSSYFGQCTCNCAHCLGQESVSNDPDLGPFSFGGGCSPPWLHGIYRAVHDVPYSAALPERGSPSYA